MATTQTGMGNERKVCKVDRKQKEATVRKHTGTMAGQCMAGPSWDAYGLLWTIGWDRKDAQKRKMKERS